MLFRPMQNMWVAVRAGISCFRTPFLYAMMLSMLSPLMHDMYVLSAGLQSVDVLFQFPQNEFESHWNGV